MNPNEPIQPQPQPMAQPPMPTQPQAQPISQPQPMAQPPMPVSSQPYPQSTPQAMPAAPPIQPQPQPMAQPPMPTQPFPQQPLTPLMSGQAPAAGMPMAGGQGLAEVQKSLKSAATWSLILGCINLVGTPILAAILASAADGDVGVALTVGFLIGAVFGGANIFGYFKLKSSMANPVSALMPLRILMGFNATVMLISILSKGGGGPGVINAFHLYNLSKANDKITKFSKGQPV